MYIHVRTDKCRSAYTVNLLIFKQLFTAIFRKRDVGCFDRRAEYVKHIFGMFVIKELISLRERGETCGIVLSEIDGIRVVIIIIR